MEDYSFFANHGLEMQQAKTAEILERAKAMAQVEDQTSLITEVFDECNNNLEQHLEPMARLNAVFIVEKIVTLFLASDKHDLQMSLAQGSIFIDREALVAQVIDQSEELMPPFMKGFLRQLQGKSQIEIQEFFLSKLKNILKSNDLQAITKKSISCCREYLKDMDSILKNEQVQERVLGYLQFIVQLNMIRSQSLNELSSNRIDLSKVITLVKDISSQVKILSESRQVDKSSIAKLCLSTLLFEHAQLKVIMCAFNNCIKISTEFYTNVLFYREPSKKELSDYEQRFPKYLEMAIKGSALEIIGTTMQIAQDTFCEDLFSVIQDAKFQKFCLDVMMADLKKSVSPEMVAMICFETFTPYIKQQSGTQQAQLLQGYLEKLGYDEQKLNELMCSLDENSVTQINVGAGVDAIFEELDGEEIAKEDGVLFFRK